MPSNRVIVDDRFRKLGSEYERAVKRALGRTASATVATARSAPTDYQIGPILGSVKATTVHRARRGWRVFVYAEDFRAVFFERGTYSRRRGKLSPRYHRTAKAEKIAAERGTGVKPVRFLARATRVARAALLLNLQRELR